MFLYPECNADIYKQVIKHVKYTREHIYTMLSERIYLNPYCQQQIKVELSFMQSAITDIFCP